MGTEMEACLLTALATMSIVVRVYDGVKRIAHEPTLSEQFAGWVTPIVRGAAMHVWAVLRR